MADKNRFFPSISRFVVSPSLLHETLRALQEEGQYSVESMVFWAGHLSHDAATITHLIVPKGPGVFKHPLQIRISDAVVAALFDVLDPPRLVLLAQVHTHLEEAFHSAVDDHFSFDTPGLLSVVVPNGGAGTSSDWERWSFYESLGRGDFTAISPTDLSNRLHMGSQAVKVCEIYG